MRIKNIQKWSEINSEATYLLLISPEEIPHLAVVSKNNYFSLTHKKSIINEPFEPYLKFLNRTGKSLLFIELEISPEDLSESFQKYDRANSEEITCLSPIRESLLPNSKAEFVFELVPELKANNLIKAYYHLNMDKFLSLEGNFELSVYSKSAIFSYIDSLNRKYAKRT